MIKVCQNITVYLTYMVVFPDESFYEGITWTNILFTLEKVGMSHLVAQQQVPDLDQIFLGEDKSYVSLDVGQEPKDK